MGGSIYITSKEGGKIRYNRSILDNEYWMPNRESMFGEFPNILGKYYHTLSSDGKRNRSADKNLWLKHKECFDAYKQAIDIGTFVVNDRTYGVPIEIRITTDYSCLVLFYMYLVSIYTANIEGGICSITIRGDGINDTVFTIKSLSTLNTGNMVVDLGHDVSISSPSISPRSVEKSVPFAAQNMSPL